MAEFYPFGYNRITGKSGFDDEGGEREIQLNIFLGKDSAWPCEKEISFLSKVTRMRVPHRRVRLTGTPADDPPVPEREPSCCDPGKIERSAEALLIIERSIICQLSLHRQSQQPAPALKKQAFEGLPGR
jgi:hypothetical protein